MKIKRRLLKNYLKMIHLRLFYVFIGVCLSIVFQTDFFQNRELTITDSVVEISKSSYLRGCVDSGTGLSWCSRKLETIENDTRNLLESDFIKREPAETKEKNKEIIESTGPFGKPRKA